MVNNSENAMTTTHFFIACDSPELKLAPWQSSPVPVH